jgi:hypothetical protein
MAEVPDLVDYRDNNDLSSPDAAFEYIKMIALEVEEGNLAFSDEEFLNYVSDVKYELKYERLTATDELPDFTDFPDLETYKKTIEGVEAFKPTLLSALLIYSAERDNLTTAEEYLKKLVDELKADRTDSESETVEKEAQESQNGAEALTEINAKETNSFPLLPYFCSRIALANPYDSSHPELEEILRLAQKAMDICDDHYLIRVNYAKAVARAHEDGLSFTHKIENLPPGGIDIINDAIEIVDGAIAIKGDYGPSHAIRARLYALRGELQDNNIESNFESARNSIKRAIELETATDSTSATQRRKYTRIQREIRLREQTAKTRKQVSQAAEEVERLRADLQQTVDRYRRNTLSFIGFFAALITLAVTSIQILSAEGGTLADKATLIIVQAGALVFAFGAFGLLLPSLENTDSGINERFDSLSVRALILAGLGLLVIVVMVWAIPGLPS